MPLFYAQFQDFSVPTFAWRVEAEDWVLIWANRSASEMTDGAIDARIGQRARTLYADHPDVLEQFEQCSTRRQAGRLTMSSDRVSSGEHRDLTMSFVFVSPDLVIVQAEDDTERINAERAHLNALLEERVAARTSEILTLQNITAALSQAATSAEVADVIVTHLFSVLGASGGSIRVLTDDGIHLDYVGGSGYAPEVVPSFQQMPLSLVSPFTDAARDRTAVWISSLEEWRRRYPENAAMHGEGGHEAAAIIPLVARGGPVGVLGMTFETAREFDEDSRRFMQSVTQQCAQALERARLYDAERRRALDSQALNDELESFAYSVSHDLRSPLRGIDGFSKLVVERHADKLDETGKHYLERIRAATHRMSSLIDDLLKLSRVTRTDIHYERVDMSELAREVLDDLLASEPGRRINPVLQSGLVVDADPQLLRVVLENLLSNAWKFTSTRECATIEVGSKEDHGEQVYFIRDDGVGFDMAYADNLFGPFQRLHSMNEFPGTGIGLATVSRIVNRHGGRAWAEASVEQGATMYFTLKVA